MESGLNVIGFTISESEDILKSFNSPSMLIYIGVVAPVVEELIYRGMVLRFLGKFDKRACNSRIWSVIWVDAWKFLSDIYGSGDWNIFGIHRRGILNKAYNNTSYG